MNAVLPNLQWTGTLSLTEVFDFYDGPKLFACQNPIGQFFLGFWIGSDEVGDSYWLVPMSRDRYLSIRSAGLDLATAIKRPELGFLYLLTVRFSDGSPVATRILPEQLDEKLLPDVDEFISLKTETLKDRISALDLPRKAVGTRRDILGLHFEFPGTREEAPTMLFGRMLTSIQDLLDALGQCLDGSATLRGAISPEILRRTSTNLVQAAGGSFGIEISAEHSVDLFSESLISHSINEFVAILRIGDQADLLREELLAIKPRAASKYRLFLTTLLTSGSPLKVDWASPDPSKSQSVSFGLNTAAAALTTVERVTNEVGERKTGVGFFVGVELPRRAFSLVFDGDEETYRGRISEDAMSRASHVTLNERYRITILETIELTASGEEKPKFMLEKIDDIG